MPPLQSRLGCTLVEALVACGLSASALAATLVLQGRALSATRAARASSVAALLASSMAAMLQANARGWRQTPAPQASPVDCAQQVCAASQLAAADAARWRQGLARALPGATAAVRCSDRSCEVAVHWDGHTLRRRVAIAAADGGGRSPTPGGSPPGGSP